MEAQIAKKAAAAAAQAEREAGESLPEVERAVLACALQDERAAALLVRRGVGMEWFHSLNCREVFCRIRDALAAGRPADAVALSVELQESGKAWGPGFVEGLDAMGALPSHAEYYVGRLADAFFRDSVREAASRAVSELDAAEEQPHLVAARLSERVAELLRRHTAASEPSPHALRLEEADVFHKAYEDRLAGRPVRAMGLSWGLAGLDAITQGLYPGLHVIAARPSFGKTMLENFIAVHHLKRGRRVARACLDMTPRALAVRALTLLSGETLSKLRQGFMTPSDEAKVRAAVEATRPWREFILTETTAEEIVARARAVKAAEGLDLLTVDYIQLVGTTEQNKFMNDNMAIARAMKAFKAFANETGTPVILLSQLSRAVEKEDRAPQLSDLRDSGSIEQDAKTVTFVYPEPSVMAAWMREQGVVDWKALAIRPGVLNVLKNQDGGTGAVAVRQFAKYGIYEEALRLTRDEIAAHRAARTAAADAAALKHRAVRADVSPSVAMGYDFSRASGRSLYSVVRHPKGAFEVLAADDFDLMNAAARRLGAEPWARIEDVAGLVPAVARLADARARHRQPPPDGADLLAADAPPSAPRDPDPGYTPDPDDRDANPAFL